MLETQRVFDDQFTPMLNRILNLANRDACRFSQAQIDPEHFCVALVKLGDGAAYAILLDSVKDMYAVRRAIENVMKIGTDESAPSFQRPLSSRMLKLIANAKADADDFLNLSQIGSAFLLASALREEGSPLADAFSQCGIEARAFCSKAISWVKASNSDE